MTQVGEPKPDLLVTGSATLDLVIPGSCLVPIQSQVAPEVSTTAGFLVVLCPDNRGTRGQALGVPLPCLFAFKSWKAETSAEGQPPAAWATLSNRPSSD